MIINRIPYRLQKSCTWRDRNNLSIARENKPTRVIALKSTKYVHK